MTRAEVRYVAKMAMVALSAATVAVILWTLVFYLTAPKSVQFDPSDKIGTSHSVEIDHLGYYVHYIDGVRTEEDNPLWDCATMGNRVCGIPN